MRRVGFIGDIEVKQQGSKKAWVIRRGELRAVLDDVYEGFARLHPDKVCDITPNVVSCVYGLIQLPVLGRFYTDVCPCRANGPRLTHCNMCCDTGRLVYA